MKRIHIPAGWDLAKPMVLHAMAHGNGNEVLFRHAEDYQAFRALLWGATRNSGVDLLTYCPNYNHYHTMLRATAAQTGEFMQILQSGLAVHHRLKNPGWGHVFRRPYLAHPKLSDAAILACSAYTHGNPFKDGSSDSVIGFEYSSLRAYIGLDPEPDFLDTGLILSLVGGSRRKYRDYLVGWLSRYPSVIARVAALRSVMPSTSSRRWMPPERLGFLVSLSQSLLVDFASSENCGGEESWAKVAAVLAAQEGLSFREIGILLGRNYKAVERALSHEQMGPAMSHQG